MKFTHIVGLVPSYQYLILFLAALGGLYFLGRMAVRPLHVVIIADSRFSGPARELMERVVTLEEIGLHTPKEVLSTLQQQLPVAEHVSVRLLSSGQAVVNVAAYRPLALVNERWVLLAHGEVVDAEQFHEYVRDGLSAITVRDRLPFHGNGLNLATFIQNLPDELRLDWAMVWHDKTNIELRPPLMPQIRIIAQYTTCFTPALLAAIHKIGQELVGKKVWRIDVRIKNQIIRACIQGDGR